MSLYPRVLSSSHRARHAAACALAAVLLLLPWTAAAHHRSAAHAVPADAIPIPNLVHGQMAAVAANRPAILALAARLPRTDSVFRRLTAYANLQFSACLWGMMPGSLTDETSPFNECTHAYLAATLALLTHMQTMPDNGEAAALLRKVERDMAARGSSVAMCRFSAEPFNTAERIAPRWDEVLTHPPSLLALAGSGLMGLGLVWGLVTATRRPAGAPQPA